MVERRTRELPTAQLREVAGSGAGRIGVDGELDIEDLTAV